jgi:hypothetical protein
MLHTIQAVQMALALVIAGAGWFLAVQAARTRQR